MNAKPIAAIGLLAIGFGAVAVTAVGVNLTPASSAARYRTSTAATTTVRRTTAASGTLVAATTYDLAFGEEPVARGATASASSASASSTTAASTSASSAAASASSGSASVTVTWPVTEVHVAVGDRVSAGDVLAVADHETAQLAVDLAEANLAAATAQKKSDRAGGTADARANAKAQVTVAQRQVSNARASYTNTVAGNNVRLRQARRALADAKAQYSTDSAAGAPERTLDADRKAITNATDALASAQLQAAASNRQASDAIASAKASLASANRAYTSATNPADEATLAADDVAIANAKVALDEAKASLDRATITSPIDGRITLVNAVVGQPSTGTAIELQSTRLALTGNVTESDVLDLRIGQSASVAVSATGATMAGTVTAVSPVATTSGSSSVVTYPVVVTLDDTNAPAASGATRGGGGVSAPASHAAAASASVSASPSASPTAPATTVLPGMSAQLTIVTAEAAQALAVPAIALSGTTGSYSVRVLVADGSVQSRAVAVGLVTSDLAQITSGLSAGDTVVTGTSTDRTSTGSSGTSNNRNFGGGLGGLNGAGGFQPPAGGFPGGGQP